MRIEVLVKPNSKKQGVEKLGEGQYRVAVHAPPIEGKANEAVIELLAKYFKTRKSAIQIVRGHKGKQKWVEISL